MAASEPVGHKLPTTSTMDPGSDRRPPNSISLNLTDHYARNWGTWEGVREIVQNWHDGLYEAKEHLRENGEIVFEQCGAEYLAYVHDKERVVSSASSRSLLGFIHYDWLTEKLFLVNKTTSLQRKILLLGYSKKACSKSVIGQFGEGLKVGALALVREGRDVTMATGEDVWKFELRNDEQLGEKVLTVLVKERSKESLEIPLRMLEPGDTYVKVTVEETNWKRLRKRFLFLHPPNDFIVSEIGHLILDEDIRSQLFVKGTWVADHSCEDLFAGVDFVNLNIDRDRNAVPKPSEIDHMVSCMWIQAVKQRPDLLAKYYDLLSDGKYRDVRQALTFSDPETLSALSDHFFELHGQKAYAVSPNTTDNDLKVLSEKMHKKLVICNETILRILLDSGSQLPLDEMLSSLEEEIATSNEIFPYATLMNEEKDILRHALKMVNSSQAGPLRLEQIDVMDIDVRRENNGVYLLGERMKVPCWMLNRELVHRTVHGEESSEESVGSQECLCTVAHLALCLINAYPQKQLNVIGYDNLRSNTGTAAWVFHILSSMANQVCGSAKQFCSELHQNLPLDVTASHGECADREREFQEEIRKLNEKVKQIQKATSKEMSSVQSHINDLEKELVQWELKSMNSEEKLKRSYEAEIGSYKAEIGSLKIDLNQTIEYWKKKCEEEMNLKVEAQDAIARREKVLLEELGHYVKECKKRTETLQKVITEKASKVSEEELNGVGISDLQDLLKLIAEDLQESRFMCNVCFQHRKTHMFMDCGHYSFCENCADTLFTSNCPSCPLCKCKVREIIRVYE